MIVSRFNWKTRLVLLDYVIIYSNIVEDHLKYVEEIILWLRDAGITLKYKKCELIVNTVNYLRYKIHPRKLETDKAITAAL